MKIAAAYERQFRDAYRLQSSFAELKAQIDKITEPWRQFQQTLATTEQFHKLIELPKIEGFSEFQARWKTLSESPLSALRITPTGQITIESAAIEAATLTATLAELAEDLSEATTLEEYFRRFVAFLNRLSGPVAFVVCYIVIPYLVTVIGNLTTPLYEDWWKEFINQPAKEVATAVESEVLEKYDPSQLEAYRFVSATRLRVRIAPGVDNKIIGQLRLGKVVKIVRTEKKWSLIEYFDDTSQAISEGWVASRYLSHLSK